MAMAVTQIATATAALTWMFVEWGLKGKPSVLGIISGAVAGLVAITPASGFVDPRGALIIGIAAGILCYWGVTVLKNTLGYDDSLDHLSQQRWLKTLAGDTGLALRSNDLANLLTAARAGLGLAVLPCIMARGAPELVSVPTGIAPLTQELWLLFHRDVGRTPAVRTVIDHITAIIKQAKAAFLEERPPVASG